MGADAVLRVQDEAVGGTDGGSLVGLGGGGGRGAKKNGKDNAGPRRPSVLMSVRSRKAASRRSGFWYLCTTRVRNLEIYDFTDRYFSDV